MYRDTRSKTRAIRSARHALSDQRIWETFFFANTFLAAFSLNSYFYFVQSNKVRTNRFTEVTNGQSSPINCERYFFLLSFVVVVVVFFRPLEFDDIYRTNQKLDENYCAPEYRKMSNCNLSYFSKDRRSSVVKFIAPGHQRSILVVRFYENQRKIFKCIFFFFFFFHKNRFVKSSRPWA